MLMHMDLHFFYITLQSVFYKKGEDNLTLMCHLVYLSVVCSHILFKSILCVIVFNIKERK